MNQRRGMVLTVVALATVLLAGAVPAADSPLLDATKRGDEAAVRSLLAEGADPNVAQGDGLTALHLAAQAGLDPPGRRDRVVNQEGVVVTPCHIRSALRDQASTTALRPLDV